MANDKEYKVLIKLQSEVEEAKKAIDALNKTTQATLDAKKASEALKGEFLSNREIITGFNMQLGSFVASGLARLSSTAMQCISDFGAQERATVGLSAALKATGEDVNNILPSLLGFANNMQRITNVGDEVVLEMAGIASAMGVSSDEIEKTIQGAIGLSKAFNMDLQTATKASSAAIQGKTELLTRYVPMLSECKTEAEKLAMVEKAQATGFQMAKDEAEDTLGSIEAMKNSLSDLGEVIGEGISPTIKIFTNGIQVISNTLQEIPAITKVLTSNLIGLVSAFALKKIGGFDGISGGFKKLKEAMVGSSETALALKSSFTGTEVAAGNLRKTLKSLALSTGAIGAISLALGELASWYQKSAEARKEFRESMQKESNAEIERINQELKTIKTKGLDEAGQKKYLENAEERISEIDKEIERLKGLKKYRTVKNVSSVATFTQTVEDPQNKAINAKIDGLKKLKETYLENSKSIKENKTLLTDAAEKTAQKNRKELAKVNAELAQSEVELIAKLRAESDATFALSHIKETIAKNEAHIREIESKKSDNQNAQEANRLGKERLEIIEKNAKLLQDQARIEKQIAEANKKTEADANAVKNTDLALNEYQAQVKILNLKSEGKEFEAEALSIEAKRNRNIAEYVQKFATATIYAQNQNLLLADAQKYANSIVIAEQKILKTKIEESALQKIQEKFNSSLPLKELEISRAKLTNNISQVEALEDALEIEKQTIALIQSGNFSEKEALQIATENVNLARELQNIERSRDLEKLRTEAKITELSANGKDIEANALQYRMQAVEYAERLRIKYSDALKIVMQMNSEQKKNSSPDGKKGSSTSFIRKQQQDIQKLLNSDNLGNRKRGERRQKAFEDRYGIGINDDAKSYKGRDANGKLVAPKVGKEAEEVKLNATNEAFKMASKPLSPSSETDKSLPDNPKAQTPEKTDLSSITSALEELKNSLSAKNTDKEIKDQKPEKDYTSILKSILSAIKELRNATMSPQKTFS